MQAIVEFCIEQAIAEFSFTGQAIAEFYVEQAFAEFSIELSS